VPRPAIAPLGLTTEGGTKFKLNATLKNYSATKSGIQEVENSTFLISRAYPLFASQQNLLFSIEKFFFPFSTPVAVYGCAGFPVPTTKKPAVDAASGQRPRRNQ